MPSTRLAREAREALNILWLFLVPVLLVVITFLV
jgi:hypothetical protein